MALWFPCPACEADGQTELMTYGSGKAPAALESSGSQAVCLFSSPSSSLRLEGDVIEEDEVGVGCGERGLGVYLPFRLGTCYHCQL